MVRDTIDDVWVRRKKLAIYVEKGRAVHLVVVSVQLVYGYFRIVVLYLFGENFVVFFLLLKKSLIAVYICYGHLNIIVSLLRAMLR